jgi:hypothetical protein
LCVYDLATTSWINIWLLVSCDQVIQDAIQLVVYCLDFP